MSKSKPRPPRNSARPRSTPDDTPPGEDTAPKRQKSDKYHDAGHPGGLPDLDKKSETEAEHDSWGRHG